MSRLRGVLPLFMATTVGVISGLWIFEPAFKEQQGLQGTGVGNELNAINKSKDSEGSALSESMSDVGQVPTSTTAPLEKGAQQPWRSPLSRWRSKPGAETTEMPLHSSGSPSKVEKDSLGSSNSKG